MRTHYSHWHKTFRSDYSLVENIMNTPPKDLSVGAVHKTNNYGMLKVVTYNDAKNVRVRFIDTGYEVTTQASHIRRGAVKDPMFPKIFGVGYIGGIDPSDSPVRSRAYQVWFDMLRRCYCSETQEKQPTYKGCSVARVWHSFKQFASWYEDNYIDGNVLDKDIKVKGNRLYSPDNCTLVTPAENSIKARAKHYVVTSPKGEMVKIYNMRKFCRDNNLHPAHMCAVARGDLAQHKGWVTSINNKDK